MSDQVEKMVQDDEPSPASPTEHVFAKPEPTSNELEKLEEEKLKAKYPMALAAAGGLGGGHSAFLQKKLAKGQKFFDSGDYQMAKQKTMLKTRPQAPEANMAFGTGEAIPTPETVPARKTSIIQPKFAPSSAT